MQAQLFRFGRCEVDVGVREIRLDGLPRPLEPRPFDLLVYLLRHRHRVVPKDELLDELWAGEFVSVGSVARAVVKARQAIGDEGRPALIDTVYRIGYHFVGEVSETSIAGSAMPVSVALLPFENLTGDPALDWITLGLMSLVCNALALDHRLAPVPVHALAAMLQPGSGGLHPQPRAEALQRLAGVQHVVQTRIFRSGHDYRLDYELLTQPGSMAGTVHAPDPVSLGHGLARQLVQQLLPRSPWRVEAIDSLDPWAAQLLARALQASAEQRWQQALRLLKVVLDIEPLHAPARVELLRVQAMLDDGNRHPQVSPSSCLQEPLEG